MTNDFGPGRRRRFSPDSAAEIMRQFNGGASIRALARKYDSNTQVISHMVSGRTYRDVWLSVQGEGGGIVTEWTEPPRRKNPGPQNTPRTVLAELVDLLAAHPGRWAHVRTSPRKPNLTWWHKRGLEAEMRKMNDGWRIYARWPENSMAS